MVLPSSFNDYREIWAIDFEFGSTPGDRPQPVCLVAKELRTGRLLRLWENQLRAYGEPPYHIDPGVLVVAYYSSAEWGCHLALGWPLPARVLDLYCEFRRTLNGLKPLAGFGLLGCLEWHNIDSIEVAEKEEMRQLVLRGGPWTEGERRAVLDYCQGDVDALARVLPVMAPRISLGHALLRGRYMKAAAHMEWAGVPVDVETLGRLRKHWSDVKTELVRSVDARFDVFEGTTFKADRWASWLAERGISWPRLDSDDLALDDQTFREMARSHPDVSLMRELRYSLSKLRLNDLAVGSDGRNRVMLSAFRAKTGRNAPSNSRFIFGPSTWLRALIKPEPGTALAYVDWSQQEFGIAAALSGDQAMLEAYESGDPYLAFGKQCGRIPAHGTKQTHATDRELFKTCVLGVQYGMEAKSLGRRIGLPAAYARELLNLHRRTYPRFWEWSDGAETHAMVWNTIHTVFDWTLRIGEDTNPRSIRNFPCQANGAEMLRLVCSFATERGIKVIAPVHDAVMVEAAADQIDDVVAQTQKHMARASAAVLGGFRLRSDAKIVHYPERYMDPRGEEFWRRIMALIDDPDRMVESSISL
jgi:hypothetical protein